MRITTASMRSARLLLERMAPAVPVASRKADAAPAAPRARRWQVPARGQQRTSDVEAMIRQIVDEAGAEAERLRKAVLQAIVVLQTAIDA